jgi:hypothetical protein
MSGDQVNGAKSGEAQAVMFSGVCEAVISGSYGLVSSMWRRYIK